MKFDTLDTSIYCNTVLEKDNFVLNFFCSVLICSSLVAFVLCVIVVQAVTVYCLIPYLW